MIKKILLFAATATLLWSCGSESPEKDPGAAVATSQNAATANTDTPNNALSQAVQAKDGAIAPQSEAGAATPASKPAGNVKLNPAHGQPGHSCSVPVGAPLTAATNTTAPAAAPQPAQMAPVAPAQQGQQLLPNGQVNPPHGQPGHVCM